MIRRLAPVIALLLALGACGGGTRTSPTASARSAPLTVFAAASLTEAFTAADSRARRTFDFAGSQALATQITQGAPADVFASADETTMRKLVDAGLVEHPVVFARNVLEIVVAPGNPEHVTGLADLARPELLVVLEDPSVPAGDYSRRVLERAGVSVQPRSLELDVKAALAKVVSGEVDAAIVYASDVVAAGAKVTGVVIPAAQNVVATYPVAVVKATSHHAAADAFVEELLGPHGQGVLRRYGFLTARGLAARR